MCSSLYGTGDRRISDRDPVSSTVFIDPPLAHIGFTAEEAQSLGRHIKVNTLPVAAIPRARTLNQAEGLFKIVVDADTQEILGCTLLTGGRGSHQHRSSGHEDGTKVHVPARLHLHAPEHE